MVPLLLLLLVLLLLVERRLLGVEGLGRGGHEQMVLDAVDVAHLDEGRQRGVPPHGRPGCPHVRPRRSRSRRCRPSSAPTAAHAATAASGLHGAALMPL